MGSKIAWIAVDWGTSNLRLWALDADDRVLERRQDSRGMGALTSPEFPIVFAELARDWLTGAPAKPVMVCGMAGATGGWRSAPYVDVPARPEDIAGQALVLDDAPAGARIFLLPGLCQRGAEAPDIMRGEETQLLGFILRHPTYSGLVCLPGTHCKWVRVEHGVLTGFTTFATGELFALLAQHSILRRSLERPDPPAPADGGFEAGLAEGQAAPERLTSLIFRLRAGDVLFERAAGWNRDNLSGLLIGAETATALAGVEAATPVALLAGGLLRLRYRRAIERAGFSVDDHDVDDLTLAGLSYAKTIVLQNAVL